VLTETFTSRDHYRTVYTQTKPEKETTLWRDRVKENK